MSKKNKVKNVPNDKTAFTKEEFYGSSRKSRRNKNKKKNTKYVSRETYSPAGPTNKIVLSVDEVVDLMIEKYKED